MRRALLCSTLAALVFACSPSDCEFERVVFQYLQTDTSDTLQPGGRAGVGFIARGNPKVRVAQMMVRAYATAETDLGATLYTGASLSDAPDKGTVVARGSVTLPATSTAPSTIPAMTIPLTGDTNPITLDTNAVYFVVLTAKTAPVTLAVATNGAYDGSYQTYGTSGWAQSPVPTERVALALQSPACN